MQEENSIIRQIYLGEATNSQNIKHSKKCEKLQNLLCKKMDDFQTKLTEVLKAEFDSLFNSIEDLHTEELMEYYVEGVKLGTRFAIDALWKS